MKRRRNRAQCLRTAVELLPARTREAMLQGIESNEIIVGAYTDRSGGVCPMLAAHRNGGRTSFASFARAWDDFTHARRPRRATRREIGALRAYLEMSLLADEAHGESLAQIAAQIRTERPSPPERPGDRFRASELHQRVRWSWIRPARSLDLFEATLAAASEQLATQQAGEVPDEAMARTDPHRAG
jgi:hypothetical protein